MATTSYSIQNIGVCYGIVACLAMIAHFFAVNLLALQDIAGIRFAIFIFILFAVVLAIGVLRRKNQKRAPYLPGLALGFLVGLVGSALLVVFVFIHAHLISPGYAAVLENQDYNGLKLLPLTLAGSVTRLGTAAGTMTGYILMMAFDNSGKNAKD